MLAPLLALTLLMAALTGATAFAESYEAEGMRLLRYEGDVEILDEEGNAGLVMENIRLADGETLGTGEDS